MAGGFRHISVERRPINELEEWGSRREVVSIIELTAIYTVYISSSESARAIDNLYDLLSLSPQALRVYFLLTLVNE